MLIVGQECKKSPDFLIIDIDHPTAFLQTEIWDPFVFTVLRFGRR